MATVGTLIFELSEHEIQAVFACETAMGARLRSGKN